MPLTVPPATNYPNALNAVPTRWQSPPVEGSKLVGCEVDWATMGGENNTVFFNLQNNATLNFSQIVGLAIDNSACGADLEFIFPDSETTLSIPAYAPYTIVPVFTNQTQFYLSAPNAQSEDITRFSILNTLPPPVAVPTSQEQDFSAVGPVNVSASGTQQLVDSEVNGTLEGAYIYCDIFTTSSNSLLQWALQDGNSNIIAQGRVAVPSDGIVNFVMFNPSNLRVRFQKGLSLVWTSTTLVSSYVSPMLYYRTP